MLPSLRNFAITFFVSLVIFGALAYCFAAFAVKSLASGFEDDPFAEETAEETENVPFNPFEGDPVGSESSTIQGDSFNFLLIGLDYQPSVFSDYGDTTHAYLTTALSGPQRKDVEKLLTYEQKRDISADAILVGRVDKENRRLVLTALSGNTRVMIDGVYTDLGSVLINKGMPFFRDKITALTGFPIDYYAAASLPAMESIIDRLGGLSFRVPCDMEYEDPDEGESGLVISLKEGSQWLSGRKAMQVLRYAGYEDRDISRMTVLRDMASAMMTKLSSFTTAANAPELFKTFKNSITTNMSFADFTDRLDLLFKIGDFTVVSYAYPGRVTASGGDTWFVPDISSAITALAKYR